MQAHIYTYSYIRNLITQGGKCRSIVRIYLHFY